MLPRPLAHEPTPTARDPRRMIRTGLLASAGLLALGAAVFPSPATAQEAAPAGGAGVAIETATNGVDADVAPGPSTVAGEAVTWTWTVTATGTLALYDLVVSDTGGAIPDCDVDGDGVGDGTNIHPGPLDPGASFTCWAVGGDDLDPTAGTFGSTGRVVATDFDAAVTVEDTDPSHHTPQVPFVPQPQISIRTAVNGQSTEPGRGPLVAVGGPVTWTHVVTNTGNVPLSGIQVGNDAGHPVDCGGGSAVLAGTLAPGASATCTSSGQAVDQVGGPQESTGSVVAIALDPQTGSQVGQASDDDSSTYIPVHGPERLAFTGPRDRLVVVGLTLTALGLGLIGLSRLTTLAPAVATALGRRRRRTAEPVPAEGDRRPG